MIFLLRLGKTGYRVTMIPCDNEGNEITEGDILAQCRINKLPRGRALNCPPDSCLRHRRSGVLAISG